MRQYRMSLLIRQDPQADWPTTAEGPEQEVKTHVTAESEVQARRRALEIAWCNGYLVSRFTHVESRELA